MTSPHVFCLLALFVSTTLAATSIHMYADPPTIKPPLTPHLTIKCELNSTSNVSEVHHHDDCNVTSTSKEIEFISSILITKDTGEEVASVTEHDAARLNGDGGSKAPNTAVTGSVTGSARLRGYLQVTMPYPSPADAGVYVCEVNAVAKGGHGIGFKSAVNIAAPAPSVTDLIKEMASMKKTLSDHKATISTLESQNVDQDNEISAITTKNSKQDNQISAITTTNANQDNQISALQKDLVEVLHVETGEIDCGNGNTWKNQTLPGSTFNFGKSVSQQFKTPYTSKPTVFLSLRWLSKHQDKHDYFGFALKNVSMSGFEMFCESHTPSNYWVNGDLKVSWLSVATS